MPEYLNLLFYIFLNLSQNIKYKIILKLLYITLVAIPSKLSEL